jgi:sensor histidine kinase YesM
MELSPSFFVAFYRRLNWHQLILLAGLTTLAVLIIMPYFAGGYDCAAKQAALAANAAAVPVKDYVCPTYTMRFWRLWHRLFIVALVMFVSYLMADLWWRRADESHHKSRLPLLATQLIAVSLGAFIGTVISGLIIGRSLLEMFSTDRMLLGILVFTTVGIGIGAVTATVLIYRSRAARADADIAKAEAARYELEKQVLESRLKLMQAQIEPHFLFNTLANVQHLTESNPPLASKTLQSLITYLRAALPEMREGSSTLGREMTMAIAYLDIQKVRMGTRLQVSVDMPAPLARTAFPPMMLLTLIENAIKHGLDPAPDGGQIVITAKLTDAMLEVSVADTGRGLSMAKSIGVGLTNIRERLATLYGKAANLQLTENTPSGVVATISIKQ